MDAVVMLCYRFITQAAVLAALALSVGFIAATASAATITLMPPNDPACGDNDGFAAAANALQPGDELIVSAGTYCQTPGRSITLRGTPQQPIVIRAADDARPLLTRPEDPVNDEPVNNNLTVISEHAEIRGLTLRGGNAGLTVLGGSRYLTLADNEIAYTGNNGLRINQPGNGTEYFHIVGNHIHHTGLYRGEPTEGEGMYVGCNSAACIARYHLIEGNYIHDLRGSSGGGNDGIEIKYGSYGNVIRDNVIHTTTIDRRYPCIFVYGVQDPSLQPPNVVDGNALWNCGEAVQAVADAVVVNNIIFSSDYGVTSYPHAQVPWLRRVSIAGNTLIDLSDAALLLRWNSDRVRMQTLTLANNAVYNDGGVAADAHWPDLTQAAAISANRANGAVLGGTRAGFITESGARAGAFVDADGRDVWPRPGGPLRGAADPIYLPERDFNDAARRADVGAYDGGERAANPGWRPAAELKPLPAERCRPVLTVLAADAPHPIDAERVYRVSLARLGRDCVAETRFQLAAETPIGWQARFAADAVNVAGGTAAFADVTLRPRALPAEASAVIISASYAAVDGPRTLRAALLIDRSAPETPLMLDDFESSVNADR